MVSWNSSDYPHLNESFPWAKRTFCFYWFQWKCCQLLSNRPLSKIGKKIEWPSLLLWKWSSAEQIHGQICGQMPFSSEYIVWTVIPKSLLLSTVLMFLLQNRSTCNLNTSLLESCFQFFCGLNQQPLASRAAETSSELSCQDQNLVTGWCCEETLWFCFQTEMMSISCYCLTDFPRPNWRAM